MIRLLALFGVIFWAATPSLWAQPLPRVVVGLYDGAAGPFEFSNLHQLAEMPLNHLGLILRPHDIRQGLPQIEEDDSVRGVISWYPPGTQLKHKHAYLRWGRRLLRRGKRFVVLGAPGFWSEETSDLETVRLVEQFFAEMGIQDHDQWVELTYDHRFSYKDPLATGFERKELRIKPPYARLSPLNPRVKSYLAIMKGFHEDTEAHLIMAGPKGGYASEGYALFHDPEAESPVRQWYVDPFQFFARALGTDDLPKPDTNTLAGSRIFYSHIDGDGWNNQTQIEEYRNQLVLSSEVIYQRALKPYPGIPVSVSAIAAELDPQWSGNDQAQEVARRIYALEHIEAATHTYSHPFQWNFFADGNAEKERAYLHLYRGGGWGNRKVINRLLGLFAASDEKNIYKEGKGLKENYDVPRAYARKKFDLQMEVRGSARYVEQFTPKDKKVKILMWSGDTTPFEAAIAETEAAGLANINGGDSRMDRQYPSYAWVAPIGRVVGGHHQIYSSNSNENTYTDLWTGGFHGFRYLANTVFNTESPIRVKPFNIYYHMYSGEKLASFNALIENIELAKRQRLTRIRTSLFSRIGQGFYLTQIHPLPGERWEVRNRGALQTLRFDHAALKQVDYRRSVGVVGHHHLQGSLYVYLDKSHPRPRVKLKPFDFEWDGQPGQRPFLDWGTWEVWDLERQGRNFRFKTRGWGPGRLRFVVDPRFEYDVKRADGGAVVAAPHQGGLLIELPGNRPEPVELSVRARR